MLEFNFARIPFYENPTKFKIRLTQKNGKKFGLRKSTPF